MDRVAAQPISILHVDDNSDFADMAATFLERENDRFTVQIATSARDGLAKLSDEIDCIVSDYDMPEMDGIEFLEAVRADYPDLPFILFTGKGSEEVASDAISAGVTDYLQKRTGTDQYALLANRIDNVVESARAKRERQRNLNAIETAQEGISLLDSDGHFIYVNQAYADIYDYDRADLLGEHWEKLYPDEEIETMRREVIPSVRDTGSWRGETTGLRADGTTFIEDHSLARTDDGGLICTVQDITERKEQEQELDRKTRAMDEAPVGITMTDFAQEDNPVVYANDEFTNLTGYPREDIIGRNHRHLQGPDTSDERRADFRRAIDSGEAASVELRNYRKDGTMFWNHVSIAPLHDETGEITHWVGFQEDVTERKEREQELEATRERMQYALDVTDSIIYEIDLAAGTETRHGPFERLFGIEPDRVSATESFYEQCVHPEDQQRLRRLQTEGVEDDTDIIKLEFRTHPERGEVRWLYSEAYVTYGPDGEPQHLVGLDTDITDRKEQEEELRRLNKEYMSVFEHVQDSLFMAEVDHDADEPTFKLRYINPANATLLGISPEEVKGKPPTDVFGDDVGQNIVANYERCLAEGQTISYEEEIPVEEGTRYFETTLTPVEIDGEITQIVGVAHEITERKHREHELERQNERLREFAGVVSHDLRNPLRVAEGRLELAQEDCESTHLDDIGHALGRMDALIDDLLSLAREKRPVKEISSVTLDDLAAECWRTVGVPEATLVTATDVTIRADQSRLKQLLENLMWNAVEHGGSDVTVTIGELPDGFYVADDGPGIPEKMRSRVFETGYSTSADGTGFGLAIVKDIADAHDWEIAVTESDKGGARFEITGVTIES